MAKRNVLYRLWALAGLAAAGAVSYWYVLRPRNLVWGATEEEIGMLLPGDELVQDPKISATHAVTVHAPAEKIWPWLAQLGQGRGGFYSYDFIENLMGLDIHNSDRLLPEYQNIHAGDKIPFASQGMDVPVAIAEPNEALVLHGDTRLGEAPCPMNPGEYFAISWGFYLKPAGHSATRLIERWKADWSPSLKNTVFMHGLLEPGAFFMERKMLLGIKQRAEASVRQIA